MSVLQNRPEVLDALLALYRERLDECQRVGKRYGVDYFAEDLGDAVFAAVQERGLPDSLPRVPVALEAFPARVDADGPFPRLAGTEGGAE